MEDGLLVAAPRWSEDPVSHGWWWTELSPLVVPVEHAQRSQRVPAARVSVAVLERELGLARMGVLEQPGAVGLSLVPDQLNGLGDPLVRGLAGTTEVVEGAKYVVVPARRPGELEPVLGGHLAGALAPEQVPLQQVLLAATPGSRHGDGAAGQLVLEQALEYAERGVERRHGGALLGFAVPAAVPELFGEQTRDEAVDVGTEVGADGERAAVDAGLDLALEERLAVVLPPAVRRDQRGRLA